MKRKLIRQGHNTMTVTLPIKWVRRLKLDDKDEISVAEQDDNIIISAKEKQDFKKITLDITDFTVPMIWRFFQSAYREGYNEIKVVFDPKVQLYESVYNYYTTQLAYAKLGGVKPPLRSVIDMLQDLVNRFIGIEIIEVKEGYCIIKDMGEPNAKEFSNSLRRIFFILSGIFDRSISAIKNNEVGHISICKDFHSLDINADRFIDYCCRTLNMVRDVVPQNKKAPLFSTLFILELLGDEFKYLGTHLARAKKNVSIILPFAEKVMEHFKLYEQLFYNFNRELAIEFGKNDFRIYNEHSIWKEKLKGEVDGLRGHLMQISKFLLCLTELKIEIES